MIKKIVRFFYRAISAIAIVALGAGVAWLMYSSASTLPLRQYFSRSQTNAVWDWSNPLNKNQKELRDLANFLYLHQLNTVYVHVDAYAKTDTEQIKLADEAMEQYIKALQKHDIKVFAVGGDVSWSSREEWHKPTAVLNAVKNFNQSHPDTPFAGVEFDVEAYNQKGFSEGSNTVKSLILGDFLDMVDMLATNVEAYNKDGKKLELGFAIPYWLDNENGNIPSITWQGKTGPTLYHLLDRLQPLEQSNVVVMAYRNAARGNDGVIAHSRTEIEYADAKAPNVNVLIGQELGDVEPQKITYYGQSSTELSSQIRSIESTFKETRSYGGIALNDLAFFQEMEQSN
ncbi:MAG TPA: hypothetical protein VFB59_02275 [Candidatus Saccharimonadales bacterium]|nr:hypothetical protein [Candidatus Saccharimonadales bacterium]